MNYEKAYKEALERAKRLRDSFYQTMNAKRVVEEIFPVLAESEDEKIIEGFYTLIRGIRRDGGLTLNKVPLDKCEAWLEKQKEQKPVKKEIALTDFEETLNTFLFDFANSPIEDCEPKEYIKKHSAEILKAAYKELNTQLQQDLFEAKQEGRREGYEVAKEELKPAEWRKEDWKLLDEMRDYLMSMCHSRDLSPNHIYEGFIDLIDRLKSLRPQPHWKPSEEQMGALKEALETYKGFEEYDAMKSLYNELKKLM